MLHPSEGAGQELHHRQIYLNSEHTVFNKYSVLKQKSNDDRYRQAKAFGPRSSVAGL